MNCIFVPQTLSSNQACKYTGVSPKRITRKSFSRFIRHRFLSSPSQLAFRYHASEQMHMYITKNIPVQRLRLSSVLTAAAYVFSPGQQSNMYQSCLPASTSHESASASLHCLSFRSFCLNKETLSWRKQISAVKRGKKHKSHSGEDSPAETTIKYSLYCNLKEDKRKKLVPYEPEPMCVKS